MRKNFLYTLHNIYFHCPKWAFPEDTMAKMDIREEEVRTGMRKRLVVQKTSADALKIAAFAEKKEAIYNGTIYVDFVCDGKVHSAELPTYRIRRAMNRFFDKIEPRQVAA